MSKSRVSKLRQYTEAQKLAMAAEVNAYRKANPTVTVDDALAATGVEMKHAAYWTYRKRLEQRAELEAAKHNGEAADAVFPLASLAAALPARTKGRRPKTITAEVEPAPRRAADDKLQAVAQILEGFARLLK